MKLTTLFLYLLSVLGLLTAESSWACKNIIAESEIAGAIALQPGIGAKPCGANDPCVCYDGFKWETSAYIDVSVPDLEKPILKEDVESCMDPDSCQAKLASKVCSNIEGKAVYRQLPDVSPAAYEIYCYRYQKKMIKQLTVDAVKKAALDKAKADAAAEAAALIAKRTDRLAKLIVCAKLNSLSATRAQLDECNLQVIREVVRDKLSSSDQ